MFRFDPKSQYMMPAHFGPRQFGKATARYNDVTTLSIGYLTDREKLSRYLPEPFEVGAEPLVSVSYSMNREIDWLAGRSYNILGVNASAVFRGEVDHIAGSYCLVLWENLTDPILTGREIQGIPKIYADIQDHSIIGGVWSTSASHWGHKFVDLSARDLRPASDGELDALRKASNSGNWMGWKYIPTTGSGAPGAEVSHATLFPTSTTIREAWYGTGALEWHRLTWEQNPTQFHIVNALEELPILETRYALVTKGGSDLAVPGRAVRALR